MGTYVSVARAASGLYNVKKGYEIEYIYIGTNSCEGMPVQKMDMTHMSLYVCTSMSIFVVKYNIIFL
jgi:hypothetical protein